MLASDPERGSVIEEFDDVRRIVIKRRPKGHGHVAIYQIEGDTIFVVVIYHTAQD